MIGATVERRDPFQHAWLACILIGALLVAANFALDRDHLARLSAAPFVFGLAFLAAQRRPFKAHFEEHGFDVVTPDEGFIAYDRIDAICIHDRRGDASFAFDVYHSDGVVHVPRGLTVPSIDVFHFLKDRMPEEERVTVPASLRSFLREQEEEFGPDRVWAYRSMPPAGSAGGWVGVLFSLALVIVGIIWAALAADDKRNEVWLGIGVCALLLGLISLLIFVIAGSARRNRFRSTGKGGLVIGPIGLALQQGDLRGQMRWDEITDIVCRAYTRSITIWFAGGSIKLRNVYNRSLHEIYRQLKKYW
jgi:hypothetical protein